MKKLYKVTMEISGYAFAINEIEAAAFMRPIVEDAWLNEPIIVRAVEPSEPLLEGWDPGSLVYGTSIDTQLADVWPKEKL